MFGYQATMILNFLDQLACKNAMYNVKRMIDFYFCFFLRYLHIVLYLAERAWSYAMELKQATGNSSSRKRIHLIRRLSKAARWGNLFSQLCTSKADPRTALEAEVSSYGISCFAIPAMALHNFLNEKIVAD